MKKTLSVLLAFLLLLGAFSAFSLAEEDGPAIVLTSSKDSYDCGQVLTITATVINAEETEENLNAMLTMTLCYEDGTPVDGYIVQGSTGFSVTARFPLRDNPGMTAGTYKIVAEKIVDGEALHAEFPFYFSGWHELEEDYSDCSIDLHFETQDGGIIRAVVLVTDADGAPVEGARVDFTLSNASGTLSCIYNVTGETGTCSLGYRFSQDEDPTNERYMMQVVIYGTEISQTKSFWFLEDGSFSFGASTSILNVTLTTDKESYDYYNVVTASVAITNADGTTDGIEGLIYSLAISYPKGEFGFLTPIQGETVPEPSFTYTFGIDSTIGTYTLYITVYDENWSILGEASASFYYTGELVPCEGEHVWSDWAFADAGSMAAWGYEGAESGHYRTCQLCGSVEVMNSPCTFSEETERWYFVTWNEETDEEEQCESCYEECQICTICGNARVLNVHHDDLRTVEDDVEPDCTHDGYHRVYKYCETCGYRVYDEETYYRFEPALGHAIEEDVCTRCGMTVEEMIFISTFVADKTEATNGEEITCTYTLTDCEGYPIGGAEIFADYAGFSGDVSGTGYGWTDENGVVQFTFTFYGIENDGDTVTLYARPDGKEEAFMNAAARLSVVLIKSEETVFGDIDKSGAVTINDVTALLDILSGSGEPDPDLCDLDGDGGVSISDVTRLLDLLSGA